MPQTYPDNTNPTYPPSQPNQFSPEEYKAHYVDLEDDNVQPFNKTAQHQTYAVGADAFGASAPKQKQSYSSEYSYSGKDTEESVPFPPPRIVPMKQQKEVDTRTFWQKVLPESIACRLYVITVLVQTTIDLAIEGDLLLRFHKVDSSSSISDFTSRKMPVYLGMFGLAHLFQFAMAVDAVYARNTLQFISLTIFNALFLIFVIIHVTEINNSALLGSTPGLSHIPVSVLTAAIPVVIVVAEVIYIGLAWKIYHEFGWKVYKFLGADRRIKKMYAQYQVYQCLVKFDVFFWVGFSVQFIWLVLNSNDWEYYVTCAAFPLSIVLLVEGHLAAQHENKWMMGTFMSGCVGALIYFVYKLVHVIMFATDSSDPSRQDQYKPVFKSLTTFSVIAIVLLIITMVYSVIIIRNFGRGLKTSMTKNKHEHTRWGSQHLHHRAMSTNLNRMSID